MNFNEHPVLIEQSIMHYIVSVTADEGWWLSLSVPRNYDPSLHPFEVCREYTRALNSTKLERVLAKPFLAALDGHRDGVNCMAKHATSLSTLLSGSCDGEVTLNQSTHVCPWHYIVYDDTDRIFLSPETTGKIVESDKARLCPHTASTRRFCAGHGCSFLWNVLFHGNYCVTSENTFLWFSVSSALSLSFFFWKQPIFKPFLFVFFAFF